MKKEKSEKQKTKEKTIEKQSKENIKNRGQSKVCMKLKTGVPNIGRKWMKWNEETNAFIPLSYFEISRKTNTLC